MKTLITRVSLSFPTSEYIPRGTVILDQLQNNGKNLTGTQVHERQWGPWVYQSSRLSNNLRILFYHQNLSRISHLHWAEDEYGNVRNFDRKDRQIDDKHRSPVLLLDDLVVQNYGGKHRCIGLGKATLRKWKEMKSKSKHRFSRVSSTSRRQK